MKLTDLSYDENVKQKLKRESESENASLTPTLYRVTRRYHRMRGYCIKATDPDHAKVIARRDFTEITETEPLDVEEW